MKKVCLCLLLALVFCSASAQRNGSVRGIVYDTIINQPVPGATVTVVARIDSSLVSFGMTDEQGRFDIVGIADGEYRLMVTHVNYHNRNIYFSLTADNGALDLERVRLDDRAKVLEEVVVTNEAPPVTLVGDTVQYNAGSFKVQPNASVEQLLKKLPGVKVESDGTIKAQGEKVNRVLVDGKEFFGNDPKIATKNLPADAIDKVQVYDKQSDQAQLTGFEDGNYEKTINLKLKADKKKGAFGKITGGAGTDQRYEGKFNVNSFRGARQLSAIGMTNNTNAEGFSFMDILNFSGGLSGMQNSGGNISINLSSEEMAAMGMANNKSGVNTALAGGLNYNNIIGKKLDLQSSFFYNRLSPEVEKEVSRHSFLPGTTNYYDQYSRSKTTNNNQRLNLNLLYEIDSMHSLRIKPTISHQSSTFRSASDYSTLSETRQLINDGMSNSSGSSEGYNFSNELIFRKKFSRKGRTFSATLNTNLNDMNGEGMLNSITNFYGNPVNVVRDTIDQQYSTSANLRSYNARLVYTEPIFRRSLLELSLGNSGTRNTSERVTNDFNSSTGKFDVVNAGQTNDFLNTYGYSSAGIRMRTQKRKYNYSLGLSWQRAELEGKIISGIKDSIIAKVFTNILANASFKYNFSRFRSFSLTYNTFTTQPTVSQLQPVADISNRLNIRQGNPDLRQEYSHALQGNLNLVSPYKNRNFFLFFNMRATSNKIVNYDSVDLQTGVRYTRPVNVDGVYNLNASASYSLPLRFVRGSVEFSTRSSWNRTRQFINSRENEINTWTAGPELRFELNPGEKLNLGVGVGLDYYRTRYSLQPDLDAKFLSAQYSFSLAWDLPSRFFLSTDFTYTTNSQLSEGYNTSIPIWNTSISKQFLKFNRGELKLSVSDILNRNLGISRNTNQNYIEDVRVNSVRRFDLLSFTYSLSKTGLNNAGGGGFRVIRR